MPQQFGERNLLSEIEVFERPTSSMLGLDNFITLSVGHEVKKVENRCFIASASFGGGHGL